MPDCYQSQVNLIKLLLLRPGCERQRAKGEDRKNQIEMKWDEKMGREERQHKHKDATRRDHFEVFQVVRDHVVGFRFARIPIPSTRSHSHCQADTRNGLAWQRRKWLSLFLPLPLIFIRARFSTRIITRTHLILIGPGSNPNFNSSVTLRCHNKCNCLQEYQITALHCKWMR